MPQLAQGHQDFAIIDTPFNLRALLPEDLEADSLSCWRDSRGVTPRTSIETDLFLVYSLP